LKNRKNRNTEKVFKNGFIYDCFIVPRFSLHALPQRGSGPHGLAFPELAPVSREAAVFAGCFRIPLPADAEGGINLRFV